VASLEFDAQSDELEFTAPVDAIGSDAWSIGGLSVSLTSATEIVGSPQVGDMVKVHAMVVDLERLVAREIELVAPAASGDPAPGVPTATPIAPGTEIEFFGNVVEIGASQWTVGDRVLAVTTQTEIKGTLAVGDLAKVHAIVQPDASLTAREIEPAAADDVSGDDSADDDGDHLEFRGIVDSIVGDTWVVAGMTFRILPGTEVKDLIIAGDFVKVEAVWSSDGVLTAVEVELEDEADDDGPDDSDSDDDDDSDSDDDDDSGGDDDDGDDDNSGSGSGGSG
jgi:hypothetical protein